MDACPNQSHECRTPNCVHTLEGDAAKRAITFTVTLADGTEHSFTADRVPANWKSWTMRQCPYGTVFQGCTFTRSR